MTRRNLRESIFKILFGLEFNRPEEMQEQAEMSVSEMTEASEEDAEYIKNKVNSIVCHKDEIDNKLNMALEGWSLGRIGKAELAILRLAIYEIYYDDSVPYKVAVNEAVELSKVYCNKEAKGFINGVLAKFSD